ncbi:hypothetical protein RND71_043681 [Anisodus tanguticus]|uniref:Uncharacterized protein n=1 Tax=Anisodus tanguticus TaxID=243964 RepID=A0AAE1QPN4_9SOLA|nr:hypothetical protein RND71_043681 [Anisodus tanguticus]
MSDCDNDGIFFEDDLLKIGEAIINVSNDFYEQNELAESTQVVVKQRVVQTPDSPGWYYAAFARTKISPQWGSSSMPFHRYLPAEYSDKISSPKSSIFYNNLENNNNEETIEIIRPLRKKTKPRSKREIKSSVNMESQDTILVGNVFKDSENLFGEKQNYDSTYFDSSDWINNGSKRKLSKRFAENDQVDRSFGLPNVRTVALALHTSNKKDQDNFGHLTVLMAFFTQFVFHDLAHVAQSVGHKGHRIKCCNIEENDKYSKHPECWPISIAKNDPIFTNLKQSCMEYVRSSPTIRVGCTLGPREQINQVTSFIDGSTIYGSSEEEAKSLRLFTDGLLKGQFINDNNNKKKKNFSNQLLPAIETSQDCRSKNRTRCFKAGDIRVNENIGLTIMHTLWARKHNRIATGLKKVNPEWTDEKLYQEARKIVGAQLQHIIYNELLPVILGEEAVNEFNLKPLKTGFYYGYDIDLNPSVSNALAVAVMPFIYTMLPEKLERYTESLQKTGVKKMSDTYFNPSELYNYEMFDEYILGLMNQNAKNPNLFYNNEMTNSISKQMKEALDLISVIIQQGRDHAIPSYTEWRKNCKLKPQSINDFNDLQNIMTSSTIQKLSSVYRNPRIPCKSLPSLDLVHWRERGDFVGKWKPNPYPRTKEEMEISAKNHNMIVEDYVPCDESTGMGDYPHIHPHVYENRPYAYDYDYPYRRVNYGEQVPEYYHVDSFAPYEPYDQKS